MGSTILRVHLSQAPKALYSASYVKGFKKMCKVWNVLPNPKGMFLAPPVKRSSRRAGEGSQPAFRGALQPGLARQKLCKCDEKSRTKMTPALCPNFQRRGSRCTCHMWITSNMRSVISCNISNFIGCMYDSQCDHYMVRLGSLRCEARPAMCLCLAARSEKASAWFRSPAARVRSRAAPASVSTPLERF